jgi:prophage antirepressor-like protein
MNEITRMIQDQEVRIINQDGEVWFVAKDICAYFGEQNYRRAVQVLDEDEKGVSRIATPGGDQDMIIVNESGMYRLLFSMRPTEARDVTEDYIKARLEKIHKFKRWVTHDVLPSIRKTGSYTVPQNPEQITDKNLQHIADILKSCAEIAKENSVLSERNSYLSQFAPTSDYGDPNRDGNPRYQKRRGYYVANRGADVAKRDPEKYGYQQDLFYDRLPQILMESFTSAVKRLAEGE